MTGLREYCDRLWRGEIDTTFEAHPVAVPYRNRQAEEISERILYYKGASSATTIDADGSLVMLDTGHRMDTQPLYEAVRAWRPQTPLVSAVFSHHHLDHVFGVGPFDKEAELSGWPRPRVYGHTFIARNFDRYKLTPGWNNAINSRQFISPDATQIEPRVQFAADSAYRYPDVSYEDSLVFSEGDLTFELHHARGETEDATWTWVGGLKTLFTGDLFIWAVPNAGNPQKVQRWVNEWAAALREMAGLGAETMIPGHGLPIFGADRVRVALTDTAALLEDIEAQTLAMMNGGATLDAVLHEVKVPSEALEKPYLRPVYDHPQFLIRAIWRQYGGWYDGEPDHLLPAPRQEVAVEWVGLAGGLSIVLARAEQLMQSGNLRLASHVAEYAALAEPSSRAAHELRASIYQARAKLETSSMARGVFTFAALSSRAGTRDFFEANKV